jgi:hypothetical protein
LGLIISKRIASGSKVSLLAALVQKTNNLTGPFFIKAFKQEEQSKIVQIGTRERKNLSVLNLIEIINRFVRWDVSKVVRSDESQEATQPKKDQSLESLSKRACAQVV